MKSGSLGNRPVYTNKNTLTNQVISINKKRKNTYAGQQTNGGQCVSGTCEVSWKPAPAAEAPAQG